MLDKVAAVSPSFDAASPGRHGRYQGADRIIALREGRIIEVGNHDGLLAQGGHYAEPCNTYFRHQALEYVETVRRVAAG